MDKNDNMNETKASNKPWEKPVLIELEAGLPSVKAGLGAGTDTIAETGDS